MRVLAWPAFKTKVCNPYCYLLYTNMMLEDSNLVVEELTLKRLLLNKYNLIHLHWPAETIIRKNNFLYALIRLIIFLGLFTLAKVRGSKIIETVHDLNPHGELKHRKLLPLAKFFLSKIVDSYISFFEIPQGLYDSYYPNTCTLREAKLYLDITNNYPTFLFIGYISPYKNIEKLIEGYKNLPYKANLIIAGKPESIELANKISFLCTALPNVHTYFRFIKEDELQYFFKVSTLTVLPFKEILNTGSLPLSLSFRVPVLTNSMGLVSYWKNCLGKDWVKTYSKDLKLPSYYSLPFIKPVYFDSEAFYNWSEIAKMTLTKYYKLCK